MTIVATVGLQVSGGEGLVGGTEKGLWAGGFSCAPRSPADPTWLSTNLGVLTCIQCSGVHRELGVRFSRIQSLTLDLLGPSELLVRAGSGVRENARGMGWDSGDWSLANWE